MWNALEDTLDPVSYRSTAYLSRALLTVFITPLRYANVANTFEHLAARLLGERKVG